jgi:hypothetical protein
MLNFHVKIVYMQSMMSKYMFVVLSTLILIRGLSFYEWAGNPTLRGYSVAIVHFSSILNSLYYSIVLVNMCYV